MTRAAPAKPSSFAAWYGDGSDAPASKADIYDAPLTRAGAGRAHKARGSRSCLLTDDAVAVLLAAEARL